MARRAVTNRSACDASLKKLADLGRLDGPEADALAQQLRSMADELDYYAANSQMWKEYRETWQVLTRHDTDDDGVEAFIAGLRSEVPDKKA